MPEYKPGTWKMFDQERYAGRNPVYKPSKAVTKYCSAEWDGVPCGLTVSCDLCPLCVPPHPELCWAHLELLK